MEILGKKTDELQPQARGWMRIPGPTQQPDIVIGDDIPQAQAWTPQVPPTQTTEPVDPGPTQEPDPRPAVTPVERAYRATEGVDQETAVKALEVSERTGIPAWSLIQDPSLMETLQTDKPPLDLRKLQSSSPALARMLADPKIMAAARPDLEGLNSIERLFKLAQIGWQDRQLTYEIEQRRRYGGESEANRKRIEELESQLRPAPETHGPLEWMAHGVAEILPDTLRSSTSGLAYGITGAMAALIAGQSGPQVVLPEELVTVPVAGTAAFFVGSTIESFKTESAGIYTELVDAGIDNTIALPLSDVGGMVSAGLESLGFGWMLKVVPGSKAVTRRLAMEIVTSRPVINFLTRYATSTLVGAAGETGTEVLQEFNQILTREAARRISNAVDDTKIPAQTKQEIVDRVSEITKKAFWATLPLSALGAGGRAAHDRPMRPSRRTTRLDARSGNQRTVDVIEGIAERAGETGLAQASPDTFKGFLAGFGAEYNEPPNVYVPSRRMEVLFQKGAEGDPALDRRTVLEGLGIDEADYLDALARDAKIAIPSMEVWKTVGTPVWEGIKNVANFDPDPAPESDLADVMDNLTDLENQMLSYPHERVAKLTDDFVAAGVKPKVAQATAGLIGHRAQRWAEITGLSTDEYFNRRGWEIERGTEETLRAAQDGEALAQGGRRRTDTKEFRAWFKDSKVVKNNEPLVMYHATSDDFEAFALGSGQIAQDTKGAIFFTDRPEVAETYLPSVFVTRDGKTVEKDYAPGSNIIPVYLSVQNPMVVDYFGGAYTEDEFTSFIKEAKREGHDGIVFLSVKDPGIMSTGRPLPSHITAVFSPEQIKSIFNRGTWDAADQRILYQKPKGKVGRLIEKGLSLLRQTKKSDDAKYMDAVNSGDLETAQKMVDEAAQAAGYTSPRLFRGSVENEGSILPTSFEAGGGIFLTDSEDVAAIFTYPREYGEVVTEDYDEETGEYIEIEPGPIIQAYVKIQKPLVLTLDTDVSSEDFVLDTSVQSRTIRQAQTDGFDGIVVKDTKEGVGDLMEEGTTYVAFEPSQVKSTDPVTYDENGNIVPLSQRFNEKSPDMFMQAGKIGDATRGAVWFDQEGRATISIFEGADASTAIHEAAHIFRRELQALYRDAQAPAWIYRDWITACEYVGADPNAAAWTEAQEEMFAQAFEGYLMEGEAPNQRLRRVFAQFKSWLVKIYWSATTLGVEISPEIRGVFDRLLTSEERVNQQTLKEAAMPGDFHAGTPSLEQAYQDARASQVDAVHQVYARGLRNLEALWKRQGLERASEEPAHVFMADVVRQGGFNRESLAARIDEKDIVRLVKKRPGLIRADGQVHVELFASERGVDPDELIDQMLEVKTKSQIRDDYVEAARANWEASWEPDEEIHTREVEELINEEINVLNERLGGTVDREYIDERNEKLRAKVRIMIGEKAAQDLEEEVRKLRGEMDDAAREARQAWREQRMEDARQAKLKQHEALVRYREAVKQQRALEKAERYLKRVARKKVQAPHRKGGLPYDHLMVIRKVLSDYGLVPKSLRPPADTKSLADFVQEIYTFEGHDLPIPASVMAGANGKRLRAGRKADRLTSTEVAELVEAIKIIEHNGREWKQLMAYESRRGFNETVVEMTTRAAALEKRKPYLKDDRLTMNWWERTRDMFDKYKVHLVKMETFIDMLDGFKPFGPFYNATFGRIKAAEDRELRFGSEVMADIQAAYDKIPRSERRSWGTKLYTLPGVPTRLTREEMISVAFNIGNEGNYNAMAAGYAHRGWDESTVETIKDSLTREEWGLVKDIWTALDKIFPLLAETHMKMYGVPLKKVEPWEVDTPYGKIMGGYFPLTWSTRESMKALGFSKAEEQRDLFRGGFQQISTRAKAQHVRKGGKLPPLLDFSVISRHVADTIHMATHAPAIRDTQRLLTDKNVARSIIEVCGENAYREMIPWLQEIANPQREPTGPLEQAVGRIRRNTTVVMLGLKISVALKQFPSFFQTVNMVGMRHAGPALARFVANQAGRVGGIESLTTFVNNRSVAMAQRKQRYDREVQAMERSTKGWKGGFGKGFHDACFWIIGLMDGLATYPSWLAGYSKGQELFDGDEAKAIDYADKIVRQTQPTAALKDLAGVQRGSELKKTLVMFYTFFSTAYNQMYRTNQAVRMGEISKAELFRAYIWVLLAPAIISQAIVDMASGVGDDDDPLFARYGKAVLGYYFATYPGLRDVVNPIFTGFDYAPTPVVAAGEAVIKLARGVEKMDAERIVLTGIEAAGYWWGLPSKQAQITVKGALDLARGESQDPRRLFVHRRD